jgi:uncharacterized protein YecE (DUF72 family)
LSSDHRNLRVGLCGFTIAMAAYALRFPVVEVQQTFYDPPDDETLRRWRAISPTLEFTMKAWQLVTHEATSPTYRRVKRPIEVGGERGGFRDSDAVREGWRRSVACAGLLSATAILFQTPARFGPDPVNIARMRTFFRNLDRPSARLLWEPRGARWVAERASAAALCRELDLVHVVDPFVTPPQPGQPIYWRLHGPGAARHSYTDAQLDELRRMADRAGPAPAYVLFNNLPRAGDATRFMSRP